MSRLKEIRQEKGLWILITILIFLYIIIRAIYNPLSHDEVATYFHFVQSGEYLPPQSGIIWDANNHLLNSFFSEISCALFGNSSFFLRLPNVLSFLLYAYFVALLCKQIKYKVVRNSGFVALLSVGYLVEYFALCRGYGMSMAFLTSALYWILRFIQKQKNQDVMLALFSLFLGCMANLTLINTYGLTLVLLITMFFFSYRSYRVKKKIGFIALVISSVIFMLYPIYYSLQLKSAGALYYGSKVGLWEVTVKTLTQQVFGVQSKVFGVLYALLLCLAFLTVFKAKQSVQEKLRSPLFLLLYFIVGNILAIYFLVFFMDVNFPEDRAAFYFIPLFILLFLFVMDRPRLKFMSFILAFFPLYLGVQLNIQGSIFSADERISDTLHNWIVKDGMHKPTIGAYQTHILCYNYLEQRNNRPTNFAQPYKENDTLHDYLINKKALVDTGRIFPLYDLVFENPETAVCLFKRKKRMHFNSETRHQIEDTTVRYAYFNFIETPVSDTTKALKLNIDFTLKAASPYFKGNLVFSGRDSLGNEIEYQYINIDWLYGLQSSEKRINQRFVINTENMHHYVLYLWNIDEAVASVKDCVLTIEKAY